MFSLIVNAEFIERIVMFTVLLLYEDTTSEYSNNKRNNESKLISSKGRHSVCCFTQKCHFLFT